MIEPRVLCSIFIYWGGLILSNASLVPKWDPCAMDISHDSVAIISNCTFDWNNQWCCHVPPWPSIKRKSWWL